MELATNTFEKDPEIKFYSVSCTKYKDLCNAMEVHGYPTVVMIQSNSKERKPLNLRGLMDGSTSIHKEFSKTDEEREELKENLAILTGKKLAKEEKSISITPEPIQKQEDIFSDVSASFYFNLRTGIYTSLGSLDLMQEEVLINWLELLSNALPNDLEILTVTNELLKNTNKISREEIYLTNILDKYNKNDSDWTSFCKTKSEAQGYTCGLWQLFHVVTVGVEERNKNLPADRRISSFTAAFAIRNFVEEFFQCSECVAHFVELFDSCWNEWCIDLEEQNWENAALWIWDTHNNVNVRLMKEDAERNGDNVTKSDERMAQWPSRKECRECWNEDGSYDRDKVYNFLKDTYWPKTEKAVVKATINLKAEAKTQHALSNMTFAFVFLWVLTMWYVVNERAKERSGRHKKNDSEHIMFESNI